MTNKGKDLSESTMITIFPKDMTNFTPGGRIISFQQSNRKIGNQKSSRVSFGG